jgi:hypothetical protein
MKILRLNGKDLVYRIPRFQSTMNLLNRLSFRRTRWRGRGSPVDLPYSKKNRSATDSPFLHNLHSLPLRLFRFTGWILYDNAAGADQCAKAPVGLCPTSENER